MPLCELCLSLDFAAISRRDVIRGYGQRKAFPADHDLFFYEPQDRLGDAKNILTPYHDSLESLHVSAQSCDLCRLVQRSCDVVLENMARARKLDFNYPLSGYGLWIANIHKIDGFQVLGLHEDEASKSAKDYALMGGVGICVEHESQLRNAIKGRKISSSPRSSLVLDKIKAWMRECTEQHDHTKSKSALLPTRMLEIREGGNVIALCDSSNATGEYACLSHCWGSVRPVTLTLSTFERFSNGIIASELPETFQDAVWLAHQLGIRYLWIDSLCIFQDDHSDWVAESARMCDVYRNSVLTIAASRAAGSYEGFLGNRLDRAYVSVPFIADGIDGEALAFSLPLKLIGNMNESLFMEEEPLTSRGWALQERYLSQRTLHFSNSQIYFECERGSFSEDGHADFWGHFVRPFSLDDDRLGDRKEDSRFHWYRAVKLYSQRKLTCQDDKLPAIGGLAALYSFDSFPRCGVSVPGNRYLAGLWSDYLIQGLCWSIHSHSPPGARPNAYRAPTWSWASVDGVIDYYWGMYIDPMNELAMVKGAHVDLESPGSPFGKVTHGWVHLEAIMLRLYMVPGEPELSFRKDDIVFYFYPQWDSESYRAPEEGISAEPNKGETELFAIPLGWRGSPPEISANEVVGPFFLIMKATKHQGHSHPQLPGFQRVGSGVIVRSEEGLQLLDKLAIAKERGDLQYILLF